MDFRLPVDWKNRLRTACLPGAGPRDVGFGRDIAGPRTQPARRTLPGARARGRTTPAPARARARRDPAVRRGGASSAQIGRRGRGAHDFAPNLRKKLDVAGKLQSDRSCYCHGSASKLHRRGVPEHGHRQERGPALAPAQVAAGPGVRDTDWRAELSVRTPGRDAPGQASGPTRPEGGGGICTPKEQKRLVPGWRKTKLLISVRLLRPRQAFGSWRPDREQSPDPRERPHPPRCSPSAPRVRA